MAQQLNPQRSRQNKMFHDFVLKYHRYFHLFQNQYGDKPEVVIGTEKPQEKKTAEEPQPGTSSTVEKKDQPASKDLPAPTPKPKEKTETYKLLLADITARYPKVRRKVIKCMCKENAAGAKCGADCLYRKAGIECDVNCGPSCTNQVMRRKIFSKNITVATSDECQGFCLIAIENIQGGECLNEITGRFEYGEITLNQPHCFAVPEKFKNKNLVYLSCLENGNECRFLQHSGTPNCQVKHVIVDKELHFLLVALMDIPKNTVLTADIPQRRQDPNSKFKVLSEEQLEDKAVKRELEQLEAQGFKGPSHFTTWQNNQSEEEYPFGCYYQFCRSSQPEFLIEGCATRYKTHAELREHHQKCHWIQVPDKCEESTRSTYKKSMRVGEQLLHVREHTETPLFASEEDREAYFERLKDHAAMRYERSPTANVLRARVQRYKEIQEEQRLKQLEEDKKRAKSKRRQ